MHSAICKTVFGVVVFHRSMVHWRRRVEVCLPLGIRAFFYMQNLFGVVVLHRSMVNWRKEVGSDPLGICAFFYM